MKNKKLALNTYSSLFNQIITFVSGFILPNLFMRYYGSNVNGLITSITQFVNFISFMELGMGAVVQSALYKPLAENDTKKISMIIKSADNFFKKLFVVFIIYLLFVIVFYPIIIPNNYGILYTGSLTIIISISLIAQYYFGLVNQLLITADQKAYLNYFINGLTIILNTIASIILIQHFKVELHVVKLSTSLIYLARPIFLYCYVKKHYNIDKNIKIVGEPINQKWNGVIQHISSVVLSNTDNIILSLFSTLSNVSIYSVYYMIVNGITVTVNSLIAGLQSLLGNLIATDDMVSANKLFERFEIIMHNVITCLFTCTGILIVSFVQVYTIDIKDANYVRPVFGILLTLCQGVFCIRTTYYCVIKAAGHYKETQISALIEMILNISISILLVFKLDIIGVAVGTLIAISYRTLYCVVYASKVILHRPIKSFVRQCCLDIIIMVISILLIQFIKFDVVSYFTWFIKAVIVFVITFGVMLIVNICLNKKNFLKMLGGRFK